MLSQISSTESRSKDDIEQSGCELLATHWTKWPPGKQDTKLLKKVFCRTKYCKMRQMNTTSSLNIYCGQLVSLLGSNIKSSPFNPCAAMPLISIPLCRAHCVYSSCISIIVAHFRCR